MSETINISCPGCNTAFEVPGEMVGQTVECPQCNTQFEIVAPGQTEAAAAPAESEEIVFCPCPGCKTVFEVTADMVGTEVDCPQCNTHFTITPDNKEQKASDTEETPQPRPDETTEDIAPISEAESGAYTHTVKMSRTSIGMVPVVEDNFGVDVVGQHIQKSGLRKAFDSGEYAVKKDGIGATMKTQEPPPPPKKKSWLEKLMFWKK